MAVVGEGVEDDIDLVVEFEVFVGGFARGEDEAGGIDADGTEVIFEALAAGAFRDQEEEFGMGDAFEDLCPDVVDLGVEFAEVVEVTEGDELVGEGREGIDFHFEHGVEAPGSRGEAERDIGGGLRRGGGRFQMDVCDSVIDGGETGGAWVAGADGDLDGGGFTGVDGEVVAAHVLVEVNEDVDLVLADHVGDLGVGFAGGGLPMVGTLADAVGEKVGAVDVDVTENLKLGFVVFLEEGKDVQAGGVLFEFGGDVTDAEATVGVAVVRVRGGIAEGFEAGVVEIFHLAVEHVGRPAGVIEGGVEEVAVDVGLHVEGETLAVFGDGFIEEAEVFEDVAVVVVKVDVAMAGEAGAVMGGGFIEFAGMAETLGVVDLQLDGFGHHDGGALSGFEGFADASGFTEDHGEQVLGLDVLRIEGDGLLGFYERGFDLAGAVECGREAGVKISVARGLGDGGAEEPHGFIEALEVAEDDAEVSLGLEIGGREGDGGLEGFCGFFKTAQRREADTHVNVGIDKIRVAGGDILIDAEGFFDALRGLKDEAEREAEGGFVADFNRLADAGFGEVGTFGLVVEGAEEVEGVGLVRVGVEDLAEDFLGFGKLIIVLMLQGELEGLIDCELAHGRHAGKENCAGWGSNPQPSASEADALSN